MDNNTRTQIILAAVTAAGAPAPVRDKNGNVRTDDAGTPVIESPGEYQARVAQEAARIKVMTDAKSPLSKALDALDDKDTKVFSATIVKIEREASSKRGIVTLFTGQTDKNPEGTETVRTERIDNPTGVVQVRTLQQLIGHRVLVWKKNEPMANDPERKVRILAHVEDRGIDPDFEDKLAA